MVASSSTASPSIVAFFIVPLGWGGASAIAVGIGMNCKDAVEDKASFAMDCLPPPPASSKQTDWLPIGRGEAAAADSAAANGDGDRQPKVVSHVLLVPTTRGLFTGESVFPSADEGEVADDSSTLS